MHCWERFLRSNGVLAAIGLSLLLVACNSPAAAPHQVIQEEPVHPESFGFGSPATAEDIAAWDIDIMPDGTGLPAGQGSVQEGKIVYEQKCMVCHGASGVEGPNDRLVGRLPADNFTMHEDLSTRRYKAVGSYWPYATTLYDYIRRAMPQPTPGTLTDNEVYALTAYILHLNNLLDESAVLDAVSLPKVEMPAKDLFIPDDRLEHGQVH